MPQYPGHTKSDPVTAFLLSAKADADLCAEYLISLDKGWEADVTQRRPVGGENVFRLKIGGPKNIGIVNKDEAIVHNHVTNEVYKLPNADAFFERHDLDQQG